MIYVYSALIVILSALLWRIRGGLWKDFIPANKIWFAVAFGFYGCEYFGWIFENWLVGFIDCYTSYQLFGLGVYVGRMLIGGSLDPDKDRECELIDDLLYSVRITFGEKSAIVFNCFFGWLGWHVEAQTYYLYDFPKVFGFCGTTLTGLVITFLWGLYLGNIVVMISGLAMGVCYWIGGKLEKLYPLGKSGWNWGEWIFGVYLGAILAWELLWQSI